MCVIIFIPQGQQISKEELREAWQTNPDGAGYAIRKDGKVIYHRGFMNFKSFFYEVRQYIGGYDLVLHFRISTSNQVNKIQTHPYEVGAKRQLRGETTAPVVCMNGIINDQIEYIGYNDTMSYITDHQQAFNIIGETLSKDILNIIADSTGCKWCIITPEKVLISHQFQEEGGRYYSNKNHLNRYYYSKSCKVYNVTKKPTIKSLLPKKLYKKVVKDKYLYYCLLDFIDIWHNYPFMMQELETAYTKADLYNLLDCYY